MRGTATAWWEGRARYVRCVVPLRMFKSALLSLAGLLAVAPVTSAADVALRDAPRAQDVAVAGGAVLVAGAGTNRGIAVDAVALDDGSVRRVLRVPSRSRGWDAELTLAASFEQIGLIAELSDRRGNVREWRVYAGPPNGPVRLVRRARGERRGTWVPFVLDADGPRLMVTEFEWRRERVRSVILQPGLPPARVALPGDRSAALAIAGERVALVSSTRRDGGGAADRVTIADWRTGLAGAPLAIAHAAVFDEPRPLDLAADGRVALATNGTVSLAAPGGSLQDVAGGAFRSSPVFAGSGIAAIEWGESDRRAVLIDPGSGAAQPLGERSGILERLAADADGVAWLANGCVRYAAIAGPPPTGPPRDPCPTAEVALIETASRLRGRTARVRVRCVRARGNVCRGTAIVRRARIAGKGPVVARGAFIMPVGGYQPVDVHFTPSGLRIVRRTLRRGGLPSLMIGACVQDGRVGVGYLGSGLTLRRPSQSGGSSRDIH